MATVKIRQYNDLIRNIAVRFTQHLGPDNEAQRQQYIHWLTRLRREFPYKSQVAAANLPTGTAGVHWEVHSAGC
jgi:hypothetical protein